MDVSNLSPTPMEAYVLRIGMHSLSKVRNCLVEFALTLPGTISQFACWCLVQQHILYLGVEFKSPDSQVHPREALISSDGVDLNELVLPYG